MDYAFHLNVGAQARSPPKEDSPFEIFEPDFPNRAQDIRAAQTGNKALMEV